MSFSPTKYPAGTFSWADIASKDMTATKKFMTELMGWTTKDLPTAPGMPDYTMFYKDGKAVAGGGPLSPEMEKMKIPSHWSSYVTVENVDAAAKKAEELGARVLLPGMDVMDAGRMARIQDPTGAIFFIWQPKKTIGAELVNTVGAMCWNELYTHDVQKATDFYTKLFGWEVTVEKDMDNYISISNKGRANGGIMKITPEMEKMADGYLPAHWEVYFTVEDITKTVQKAQKLGGMVYFERDIPPVGKIALISDPSGAPFMAFQMLGEPQEWKE